MVKHHDICRNLIKVWVQKYEARDFDEDAATADMLQHYETRMLRLSGLSASRLWNLSSYGGSEKRTAAEKRDYVRHSRPADLGIAEGCRLMGISRSSFDQPTVAHDDTAIVEAIAAIGDEFDFYGRRRVNESMALAGSISAQEPPINRRSFPELSASTFPRPATRRSSDPVVRRARSLVEPSALGF